MKPILILLSLVFASCAGFTGNEQKGTYAAVFLGTDFKGYRQSSRNVEVADANQSTTAVPAIRTAGTLGTASILAGVTETNSNNATREVLGGQKVDASKAAGREATEQLRISEETKRKALELVPSQ